MVHHRRRLHKGPTCVAGMTAGQLDRYEALVESADPDIYNWVTGAEPIPPSHDTDIMQLLKNFKYIS